MFPTFDIWYQSKIYCFSKNLRNVEFFWSGVKQRRCRSGGGRCGGSKNGESRLRVFHYGESPHSFKAELSSVVQEDAASSRSEWSLGCRPSRCGGVEEGSSSPLRDYWSSSGVGSAPDRHRRLYEEVWEKLKIMYLGVDRVKRARLQTLRRQFEQMAMGDDEPVVDFAAKLTKIANDIRVTSEDLSEKEVIRKFLRVTPEKLDPVTTSLDQSTNFDELTLEEVIGCLVAYEEKLQDRLLRREEKALLTKASTKKDQEASNHGRGRGRDRGRGQGRHSQGNGKKSEDGEKPRDKSKLQCYNCDKYGHFASECRKEKKEEKLNLSKAEEPSSSLLMAVVEEASPEILLQGKCHATAEEDWYLDTGASSHMTGRRHFFSKLVESRSGYVKFGDNSRLSIHGRGDLEILCKSGQPLTLHNVLFVPDLEPNILSLG